MSIYGGKGLTLYHTMKTSEPPPPPLTGRLAQLVERRTREHNVSGLYRCGFDSPAGQLKLLIVFRMKR